MEKSNELCKEIQDLEKKKEELVKKKQQEMVKEGKAFACRKCSKVVVKTDASPAQLETVLCYGCLSTKRKQEHKTAILNKIKFGRIVDIEMEDWGGYENIKQLTVYKQGMMYELESISNDDMDSYIIINKEWKQDEPLEMGEEEIKPWKKLRKEKPLDGILK